MAVDLWNRENEAQEDNDIWRWGDQKTIAFVMFTLNPKDNYWCAARRAFFDTYEDYELDEHHKAFDGTWVHNFYYYVASGDDTDVQNIGDASDRKLAFADQFFASVKAGEVVCAPNTKVYMIMHSQASASGVEVLESTWGALDVAEAFAEKHPTENGLAEHLFAQIKSVRPLMQGELTAEDYAHMKRDEEAWLASMKNHLCQK